MSYFGLSVRCFGECGTDRKPARIWSMGKRKIIPTDILAYSAVAILVALGSGMVLGHVTEESMTPRLSANLPPDPVERFGLGQNAFETDTPHIVPVRSETRPYAEANHIVGRRVNGARVLVPFEPARKVDRMRLEGLQSWNEESFGDGSGAGDGFASVDDDEFAGHEPIDVGAVEDVQDRAIRHADIRKPLNQGERTTDFVKLGAQKGQYASAGSNRSHANSPILSDTGYRERPMPETSDPDYSPKTPSMP